MCIAYKELSIEQASNLKRLTLFFLSNMFHEKQRLKIENIFFKRTFALLWLALLISVLSHAFTARIDLRTHVLTYRKIQIPFK